MKLPFTKIKKSFKKTVIVTLSFSSLVGLITPSTTLSAQNYENDSLDGHHYDYNYYFVNENIIEHGDYFLRESGFSEVIRYNSEGLRVRQPRGAITDAIKAASFTEYEDIIQFDTDLYGIIIETSAGLDYLYVGKFAVDVMDDYEFEQAMDRNDLTDNMIIDIREARLRGVKNEKEEKMVIIFCETFVPKDAIFPTPTSTTNHTYNGLQMRVVQTSIQGETAGWQRLGSGSNTRNVMVVAGEIILDLAGIRSRAISIFNNTRTIYDHFRNVRGLPTAAIVQAQATDFVDVRLTWEQQNRRTYGRNANGTWRHVVTSRRALIQRSEVDVNVRVNNGGAVTNHNMRTDTGFTPITTFRTTLWDTNHWSQGYTNFRWSSNTVTNHHAGWRVGNVRFTTR